MEHRENILLACPRRHRLRLRGIHAERVAKAADEAAPVDYLRLLAEHCGYRDRYVRRSRWFEMEAVAANPNTPLHIVAALAQHYPAAVCRNPVLPLLPLEEPQILWDMARNRPEICARLLREPEVPASIVALLAGDSAPVPARIREEARLHVARSGELSPDWAAEAVRLYWRAHAAHKCAGDWIARQACIELVEVGLAPEWIAGPRPWPGSGECPSLERLVCASRTVEEAQAVRRAADPEMTEEVLFALVQEQHFVSVWVAAAGNLSASPRVLQKVIVGHEPCQMAIALNPAADAETLRCLLRRTYYPWIRRLIWRHPAAAGEVRHLARRLIPGGDTRRYPLNIGHYRTPLADFAALLHPEASERARRHAARSINWWERLAAALALPSVSGEPLLRHVLARDGNRLVRAAAKARLSGSDSCLLS